MQRFKYYILISISILMVEGCTRNPKGYTKVQFQTSSSTASGVVGTMATLPAGRVPCYGVSIKGSGISNSMAATSCRPEIGMRLGFVGEGGILQGDVLKGPDRTFEVYLYLQPTGQNNACPSMASFSTIPVSQLYFLGSVSNVKLEKEAETITIATTFPGEAQNLVAQNSYSASCNSNAVAGASNYQIATSTGHATGTGYILQGRVGRVNNGTILIGTGIQLRVKD